ncbi:MAG: hypothetical protein HY912_11595 [Desulfomonile tiedjei]|uniref:Uncharacterized protein n=1 Tax=Desulfomonile tiedjei TaxID=2358 RepID=A0A9D6V2A6_9BACT|nr:hypothetical protein [Desulfomonile tiedjei]
MKLTDPVLIRFHTLLFRKYFMIPNSALRPKKLAFSSHLRIWAKLQALILWLVVNLPLPIEQKFTKMRLPVLGVLSNAALPGFASGLGWLLKCMISMTDGMVVAASVIWLPRERQPNLWLDRLGQRAL